MTPGRHARAAISDHIARNKGLIGRIAAVVLVVAALISVPIAIGVSPLRNSVSAPAVDVKLITITATPSAEGTPATDATETVTTTEQSAAPAVPVKPKTPKPKAVERTLHRLGLPVGAVNKSFDIYSNRAFCAWRELTGRKVSHGALRKSEKRAIVGPTMYLIPSYMVNGMNISLKCQVNYWIDVNDSGYRYVRGVFPVSSGQNGWTPTGRYSISHQIDGWHESTQFEGAMMYRPKYFNGGIALHGSISDSLVLPWPASHGCVRMLHKDIDKLWKSGVNPGTPVLVYGSYF